MEEEMMREMAKQAAERGGGGPGGGMADKIASEVTSGVFGMAFSLGVLAFACWWNLGAFHFGHRYVHTPEFFHYYLGAKYFDELGYTRLYDCAAAVEVEHGRGTEVARRWSGGGDRGGHG